MNTISDLKELSMTVMAVRKLPTANKALDDMWTGFVTRIKKITQVLAEENKVTMSQTSSLPGETLLGEQSKKLCDELKTFINPFLNF